MSTISDFIYRKTGDWKGCSKTLKELRTNLFIRCEALMDKEGKLLIDTMKQHIERQDLNWQPISQTSINMGADDIIYVETGFLRDNIVAKKVKSTKHQITFFIGAPKSVAHPVSGNQLTDIMLWMEYGTSHQPPRPLIRPTWEELVPIIKDQWIDLLNDLLRGRI